MCALCNRAAARVRWRRTDQMLQRAFTRRSLSNCGSIGCGTSREGQVEGFQGVFQALLEDRLQARRVALGGVGDLLVHGEYAVQHLLGLERGQYRLQCVVHGQHVRAAAAGGERQHHLVLQGALGQQVEQDLQRAGKRGLVHRGGDQQAVGAVDLLGQRQYRRTVEAGTQQVLGGKIQHLVAGHLDAATAQPVPGTLQQHPGAGAYAGTSGDGNDEHGGDSL